MKRSRSKSDGAVVLPGQMDLFGDTLVRPAPQPTPSPSPLAIVEIATSELAGRAPPTDLVSLSVEHSAAPAPTLPQRPKRARKEPGRLLDVEAAADYVGLSVSTLNKMRCVGAGPKFLKLTRSAVRYDPADLDAWLAARRRSSTSEV